VRSLVIGLGVLAAISVAANVAPAQDTKPAAPAATSAQAAASACTGVVEADCGTTAGCVWLPGFKVPTGEEVKGYCRPAPKPLTARRPPGVAPPAEQPK
jgi:hypothetical protein